MRVRCFCNEVEQWEYLSLKHCDLPDESTKAVVATGLLTPCRLDKRFDAGIDFLFNYETGGKIWIPTPLNNHWILLVGKGWVIAHEKQTDDA